MGQEKNKKVLKLTNIASNNRNILNSIIKYINTELKENLYRDTDNRDTIIKDKPFYKQVVNRLLNSVERKTLKIKLLWEECEKGQQLLDMKRASTVQSPSYENEFSKNTGLIANTYEKKLLSIEEEVRKQQQRLIKYQVAVEEFEAEKKLFESFIDLSPNVIGVEVIIKHYLYGARFADIAAELHYEEVYYIVRRTIDDLATILMVSL